MTGYFTENDNKKSSMRLMCLVSLFASIGVGAMTILRPVGGDGVYITMAFLLGAFAPKAIQKFAENKLGGQK